MRAALYARISEDDLHQGRGVARQLEDCRELAAARGWEVVAEHVDSDVSAFNGAVRAGYRKLMVDAAAGRYDRIVCYQTSRLWRSRRERADAIDTLGRARVSIVAVKGPELDLATGYGRGMAGMLGEFDTMESEVKAERVQRAALQRAKEGRANARVAYGWRREYDTDPSGRIVGFRDVEHPEEADVVREVVRRLVGGESLSAVARDLNRRGVPTPSGKTGARWGHTTLRWLAARDANVARRIHHGEDFGPAAWPALVSDDDHARIVAKFAGRRVDEPAARPGARQHLLTYGVGECGKCGSVLRVQRKRRSDRVHVQYVCRAKACVGRSVDQVDGLVGAVVVARLARPDAAAVFAPDDDAARRAYDVAEGLRARLDTAADSYAEGAIDASQLERITARLRPQLEAAEAEAREARAGTDLDAIGDVLGERAAATWATLDVARRRAVLDTLGVRVRIMPTRRGRRGFDPDDVKIIWPTP